MALSHDQACLTCTRHPQWHGPCPGLRPDLLLKPYDPTLRRPAHAHNRPVPQDIILMPLKQNYLHPLFEGRAFTKQASLRPCDCNRGRLYTDGSQCKLPPWVPQSLETHATSHYSGSHPPSGQRGWRCLPAPGPLPCRHPRPVWHAPGRIVARTRYSASAAPGMGSEIGLTRDIAFLLVLLKMAYLTLCQIPACTCKPPERKYVTSKLAQK